MCYQCDEDNNFEDSVANPGTCVCKEGYDYVNNQCIEAIKPAIPPPTVPEKAVALESGKDFTPTGTGNNMVYTVKDSKELDQTADSYKLEVPSQVATVTIPQIQKEIFVDLQGTRNDGVTINASASTPVTVNCQNGAKLNIPTKNDITISAGQSLNVDPIEENSENVNIGNLRPNEDRLDLTSKVNVTINELDIYGTKTVTGSSDDNKKTTCTNARLARGATFTPAKMIIENIEVGLLSKVLLNQPLGEVQVGKFFIDYNRTQDTNIPVPIIFENVIPVLNTTHLEMKKINADQELLEEEKFTLAQFNFGSATEAEMKEVEKQCQNLRENYDGGGDSGFNDKPECVKTSTGYDLVAKKQVGDDNGGKNDKGLSGGAIAGIVIACVVVVAAIIALLVYFLVIKKKNASTTSTQGDSSIAI
ncbi:hypothetical protein M9Y10_018428 [Tritrichomonas musculus]|uniref:VWFD domain-containing protein n=1 Tax=Tritrichomonas musculus TaxID=1915356 RepID=A0ABR2HPE9_9EUKA